MTTTNVSVVQYEDSWFIHYGVNHKGRAKLIDENGEKYEGNPEVEKLKEINTLPVIEYNDHKYIDTKIGVFSALTGDYIKDENILEYVGATVKTAPQKRMIPVYDVCYEGSNRCRWNKLEETVEVSGILLDYLFEKDPNMVLIRNKIPEKGSAIHYAVDQLEDAISKLKVPANLIVTNSSWGEDNYVYSLVSQKLSWNKKVDTSRGMSTIKHGDYQKAIGSIRVVVTNPENTDGSVQKNRAASEFFTSNGIGDTPKVLLTSVSVNSDKILNNDYSVFKGCLYGSDDDGSSVPTCYIPSDVIKVKNRKPGDSFMALIYVVEDIPAFERYDVKLSAVQLYRYDDALTSYGKSLYIKTIREALKNAFGTVASTTSLRLWFDKANLTSLGLEDNHTVKGAIRQLVGYRPTDTKGNYDTVYHAFKAELGNTRVPGFKARALSTPRTFKIDGVYRTLKDNEIVVPKSSGFKIGEEVTAMRSPSTSTEMYIMVVVGYSKYLFVSQDILSRIFNGDTDGDFLYFVPGKLVDNKVMDTRAEWIAKHRNVYDKANAKLRTVKESIVFQYWSKAMVSKWDSLLTAAWLNPSFKNGQVLAYALNGLQDTIDCEKHSEIPFPGEPRYIFKDDNGKSVWFTNPPIVKLLSGKFDNVEELNKLISKCSNDPVFGNLLWHIDVSEDRAYFGYDVGKKSESIIRPILRKKGYFTEEQIKATNTIFAIYDKARVHLKPIDGVPFSVRIKRFKADFAPALDLAADEGVRTTFKYQAVFSNKSVKILNTICSEKELNHLTANLKRAGGYISRDVVTLS